jgi:CHAD domain-containing protein
VIVNRRHRRVVFRLLTRLPGTPFTPSDSERPRLRLVRAAPEPLGPVSPELVLVSPELAALVAGTPDAILVDDRRTSVDDGDTDGSSAEPTDEPSAEVRPHGGAPRGTVRYDTSDLVLERHGLTLELEDRGELRLWRLTLPRGEKVEVPAAPSGVPRRIAALLDTLLGGDDLRRVPTRSTSPEIRRLETQLLAQRRSLVAHDAGTRLAVDAENLHQLRVASRRARAFLRVARELVDAGWAAELNAALRTFGQASGDARDLDVLLEHLRSEAPTLGAPDSEGALQLIRMLERDRDELQTRLETTLDSREHRALLEQLALPVEAAAEPSGRTLAELAARELRRLVAQVCALGKAPADEKLHELRIRVKRVRYAAELGGLRGGGRTARVIQAATSLQDILGAHQDAVVAEQRIRGLAQRSADPDVAFAAGRLAERQNQRRDTLQQQLPAAWRRLRKLARDLK